jgi:two-component system chemotaxis sensor kinase CheA
VSEDEEIVQAFLEESRENLDRLDRDLVVLETRPDDPDLLAQVYRAVHTIKGTCGFLGFHRLEALTHGGEDLLDALRSGTLQLDVNITTSMLALIDAVRAVLERIEATGEEGEEANTEVIAALAAHLAPQLLADLAPEPPAAEPPAVESPAGATPPAAEPEAQVNEAPDELSESSAQELPRAAGSGGAADAVAPRAVRTAAHESSVRVDVGVLDTLMDLVGELVLARSRIGHIAGAQDEGPLVLPYRQLVRVTAEIQENVMQARLQPVGAVTGKFPRIARDLAASMQKRIRVELEGEDVGVDRAVNEALRDALLHLVRNTVDHGIESPAERIAAGKDPEGCLRIAASHAGGRVHVELSDDGRGADPERLAARAVSAGLLTREEADALSASSALQLMFLPGLSTKEEITTVSGRGVGMDAVRANLDQLGASIEVSSEIGQGTRFRINVPLTLAILPTVLIWSAGERYALPQIYVREVVHLERDEVSNTVDEVDGARIHRLRGRLLPLVVLREHLHVTSTDAAPEDLTIVVVEIDGKSFGIVVDAVGETIDAVVKTLTQATRSIAMFAGVTILSDGRPALIVDLDGLATAAGLVTSTTDDAAPAEVSEDADGRRLLLATVTGGAHVAVPLSAVQRLEHFPREQLQRSRGGDVVEYGDAILPLVQVAELLPCHTVADASAALQTGGHVPTIVCHSSAGPIGLVVERIEDVVAEPGDPSEPTDRGVETRLVIEQRVTELLDVEAVLATADTARSR